MVDRHHTPASSSEIFSRDRFSVGCRESESTLVGRGDRRRENRNVSHGIVGERNTFLSEEKILIFVHKRQTHDETYVCRDGVDISFDRFSIIFQSGVRFRIVFIYLRATPREDLRTRVTRAHRVVTDVATRFSRVDVTPRIAFDRNGTCLDFSGTTGHETRERHVPVTLCDRRGAHVIA